MGLLDVHDLQRELTACVIGRHIELHEETPSTNARALERADDPQAHGLVVMAEAQSAGRGRLARVWHSPKGASILMSVLLLPEAGSVQARSLLLWSALATAEAIEEASGVRTAIKWPNDLVVSGRKVCGILIESRPTADRRAYAVGIGINCLQHARHFPPEIRDRATSLDLESTSPIDRLVVARTLIRRLDGWLERAAALSPEAVRAAWLERAVSLGTRLHLQVEGRRFSGRLIELDPQAGILMELEQGGRRLFDPRTTTVLSGSATEEGRRPE